MRHRSVVRRDGYAAGAVRGAGGQAAPCWRCAIPGSGSSTSGRGRTISTARRSWRPLPDAGTAASATTSTNSAGTSRTRSSRPSPTRRIPGWRRSGATMRRSSTRRAAGGAGAGAGAGDVLPHRHRLVLRRGHDGRGTAGGGVPGGKVRRHAGKTTSRRRCTPTRAHTRRWCRPSPTITAGTASGATGRMTPVTRGCAPPSCNTCRKRWPVRCAWRWARS